MKNEKQNNRKKKRNRRKRIEVNEWRRGTEGEAKEADL